MPINPRATATRISKRVGSRYHNIGDHARKIQTMDRNKKLAYGAGVVGVSSGAYAWHRRRDTNQMYSDPSNPYYY